MSAGLAYFCGSIVLAGVIAAIGLGIRKGLRDVAWHRYSVTLTGPSLRFGPAPFKASAVSHAPARAAQSHAEPRSAAPVPQAGDMTRAVAAARLGVSERSLRRHASDWGIEEIAVPGKATLCTAESVNRRLANGSA